MLRDIAGIGSIQFLLLLVMFGRTKALAVILGPELVGLMAVVDKLVALLVQTVSLSLPFAAVRFLPGRWNEGAEAYAELLRRMRDVLARLLFGTVLVTLLITIVTPTVWGREVAGYQGVLLAAFATLPVVAMVPFIQNAIAGRFDHLGAMRFGLAHAVVLALTSVVGVWMAGLAGLYVAYGLGGMALVVAALRALNREHPVKGGGERRRGLPRELWVFSLTMFGLAFLAPFAALFVHYRVLAVYGPESAGWMQAAIGVALVSRAVLGPAQAAFLTPNVNRGGTPAERIRWADGFQCGLCVLLALGLPALALFPEVAVSLLYAPAFGPGADFVVLFLMAEALTLLAATYQSLIVALDQLRYHVVQNASVQALLILLAVGLVPRFGIMGVGASLIVTQAVLAVSTIAFLRWRFSIQPGARALGLSFFVLASLALAGLVRWASDPGAPTGLILRLGAFAAVVLALLAIVTAEERGALRRLVALGGRWTGNGRRRP